MNLGQQPSAGTSQQIRGNPAHLPAGIRWAGGRHRIHRGLFVPGGDTRDGRAGRQIGSQKTRALVTDGGYPRGFDLFAGPDPGPGVAVPMGWPGGLGPTAQGQGVQVVQLPVVGFVDHLSTSAAGQGQEFCPTCA